MAKKHACIKRLIVFLIILSHLSLGMPALAQQETRTPDNYRVPDNYRIGPGDVILLTVPERGDLSREVTIDENGNCTLPLVGAIQVTGMTTAEVELKVFQELKGYYPSLTEVKVKVIQAVSQIIYVLGQVGQPGRHAFPESPNVWEAIREAGGPTVNASLDNVRIVKDKLRGGTSSEVNVTRYLELASVDELPKLESGDTVVIPERAGMYTGSSGINVFGQVDRPGVYRLQAGRDLISAVLGAGGPARRAALNRVIIIRPKDDNTIETFKVNLEKFLEKGVPEGNPILKPGDTVHVPAQNGLAYLFTNDVGFVLNVISTTVTIAALIVSIQYYRSR
jgi:protein involved in polysaccharide export with SLBB domain